MSKARLDLPQPASPVITVNVSRGDIHIHAFEVVLARAADGDVGGSPGGAGADQFVVAEGGTVKDWSTADRIIDFSSTDHDLIDLKAMDANTLGKGDQAFTVIGTAAFGHHAGELSYAVQAKPGPWTGTASAISTSGWITSQRSRRAT